MIKKSTPKERRIILKHADDPNYSNKIDCYLKEWWLLDVEKGF